MSQVAACQWLDPGGAAAAVRIADFLQRIGIPLHICSSHLDPFHPDNVRPDRLIAGMDVRDGALWIDPATPLYPGDLLHEAGHIAVTAPDRRATLSTVSDDPGEEMAAIAWSWAAAQAAGIDGATLFHDDGYKGGGGYLADNFASGHYIGVPMLVWFGMTDAARYPEITRWLR